MPASRARRSTTLDLQEQCCDLVLAELAAQPASPASDNDIQRWSEQAYALTKAKYLAAGQDEPASRQAALHVALQVVARLVYPRTEGNCGSPDAADN